MTYDQIANSLNISRSYAQMLLAGRRDGVDPQLRVAPNRRRTCNGQDVLVLRNQGKTFEEIAKLLKISTKIAHQLLYTETDRRPRTHFVKL
jgi:DNA-binding CsgD family transcriptional regulator